MLLWQMIVRDAETLLSSPEAAWEWFDRHAPGLWVRAEPGTGEGQPGNVWSADAWEECCQCVQKLQLLAQLRERPDSVPRPLVHFLTGFLNRYLSRHVRRRYEPGGECGPEVVTSFVHWPGGQPACFYSGEAHPDDCPGAFWAYIFLSVDDQQVIPLRGGGHCENPECGRLIGMTAGGKPKNGLCAACRQRLHRSQNPDDARRANRIHNRKYRRKQKQGRKKAKG